MPATVPSAEFVPPVLHLDEPPAPTTARSEPMPMQFPPTPHHSTEIEDAVEELVACVDDPQIEMNGHADSYSKCVEAMWQAGHLVTEYMARRLGMTPLQQSMAMDRLYGVHVLNRPRHHRPTTIPGGTA